MNGIQMNGINSLKASLTKFCFHPHGIGCHTHRGQQTFPSIIMIGSVGCVNSSSQLVLESILRVLLFEFAILRAVLS